MVEMDEVDTLRRHDSLEFGRNDTSLSGSF